MNPRPRASARLRAFHAWITVRSAAAGTYRRTASSTASADSRPWRCPTNFGGHSETQIDAGLAPGQAGDPRVLAETVEPDQAAVVRGHHCPPAFGPHGGDVVAQVVDRPHV